MQSQDPKGFYLKWKKIKINKLLSDKNGQIAWGEFITTIF